MRYKNSETATYSKTSDGKPSITVTINNNEVSPTFKVPYYDIIVPKGFTETFSIEKSGFEELSSYVSISTEKNPDNTLQSFQTLTFDLVNIYEF